MKHSNIWSIFCLSHHNFEKLKDYQHKWNSKSLSISSRIIVNIVYCFSISVIKRDLQQDLSNRFRNLLRFTFGKFLCIMYALHISIYDLFTKHLEPTISLSVALLFNLSIEEIKIDFSMLYLNIDNKSSTIISAQEWNLSIHWRNDVWSIRMEVVNRLEMLIVSSTHLYFISI